MAQVGEAVRQLGGVLGAAPLYGNVGPTIAMRTYSPLLRTMRSASSATAPISMPDRKIITVLAGK